MKKVILMPDSFKGTMSSEEVCDIMSAQIKKHYPAAQTISIPVADGGEGSVDCFLKALSGEKIFAKVAGPFFEEMEGFYGIIDNGNTAVIEVAATAGLPLVEDRKDPLATTTYGIGQLILDAAGRGVKKIILGLGGSATNDAGCGAAAAVGIKFYNMAGESYVPTGGNLKDLGRIDTSGYSALLKEIEFVTMCDIDNPMYGTNGAAYVFAPQKGATPEIVRFLDAGLVHLSEVIKKDLAMDLSLLPGAGAAGAMGAGAVAFFGSRLQMGIEVVLDTVGFDTIAKNATAIFTGEGKIDGQSLSGKVVVGIGRRAKQLGVPVIAVVGDIGDNIEEVYNQGVTSIFSINRVAVDFSVAKKRSKSDLALTMDNIMRFHKIND